MRNLVIPSIVASIVASFVAIGVQHIIQPKTRVVVSVSKEAPSATRATRLARVVWEEMSQAEVDAMTGELRRVSSFPVSIFCAFDERCGDLALNMENAFESARWDKVLVKHTNFGAPDKGVSTTSQAIASAIQKATAGRIKPSVVSKEVGGDHFVFLGDKP